LALLLFTTDPNLELYSITAMSLWIFLREAATNNIRSDFFRRIFAMIYFNWYLGPPPPTIEEVYSNQDGIFVRWKVPCDHITSFCESGQLPYLRYIIHFVSIFGEDIAYNERLYPNILPLTHIVLNYPISNTEFNISVRSELEFVNPIASWQKVYTDLSVTVPALTGKKVCGCNFFIFNVEIDL